MSARRARQGSSLVALVSLSALVALSPRPALAQSNDTVTAEALFQQGKALLSQNRFSEACPKLAESQRLDPATGTLMALAMCHEGNGQLASAWAEYTDAESRSRKDGREDRQKLAHERANALRPRLSTLEVNVPPEVSTLDGVLLKRDGQEIGRGVWNSPVPIDGGEHTLEAMAPGKVPWKSSITIKAEGDRAVIKVPPLGAAYTGAAATTTAARPGEPPPAEPGTAQSEASTTSTSSGGLGTTQWIGIVTAGAGVVTLGVSGYFLATALGENSDSNKADDPDYCDDKYCGETGQTLRKDAVTHGNVATILGVAGGVLLATGVTLFVVGPKKSAVGAQPSLHVGALAVPGAACVRIGGSF
jgi:hypothetical protein